jgi:hypothetical protein
VIDGVVICCSDYRCSHSPAINADHSPDDVRLSDTEPRLTCQARAANVAAEYARISLGQRNDPQESNEHHSEKNRGAGAGNRPWFADPSTNIKSITAQLPPIASVSISSGS